MADNPGFPVGTAVVNWIDSNSVFHLRVYSTDGYTVTEMGNDGNGWAATGFTAPGSDVSATLWQDWQGTHIRIYCTFEDTTTEWCTDNESSWYQGAYTPP